MEGLTILLYCVALSIPLIFMLLSRHAQRKKLPPGPPALLFIAKLLVFGVSAFENGQMLRNLHARYGPIVSIQLGRTMVYVADRRLAHNILVKGSGNFDSRPPPSEEFNLFLPHTISSASYGAYWRRVRRNMQAHALHLSRVSLFRQRALDAIVGLLGGRRGGDVSSAVTVRPLLARCLFEMVVCMSFGGGGGSRLGQEALDEMQKVHRQVFFAATGFSVFSIFPALTKRLLRKRWEGLVALREKQNELMLPLLRRRATRGGGAEGEEDPPCYADSLLELRMAEEGGGGLPLTDDMMVALCSEFMLGAMYSSLSLLEFIMAELVNHPDVQAKVYEEVRGKQAKGELGEDHDDDHLGRSRIPYLKAVVLEGLRMHPGGPLVLPHSVQSDAEIGGYMVPKGAEINFLVADLGFDETLWTAPREFRPERFLHGGDMDITGSREIKMAPFGAGRRMCPGYLLAILHAEYFVGGLVKEFQWLPPAEDHHEVDMTEELDGLITMKHPLRVRVIPRT